MTGGRSIVELAGSAPAVSDFAPRVPRQVPRWQLSLYALTVFLSAFLLFQVEPLIAKLILPWFGGTAGVWSACMLVFQVLLFCGYAYAHFIMIRLSPRWQAVVHVLVLAAACATLPILPSEARRPTGNEDPVTRIVLLLFVTVGVPFFALSATGPLLQGWFGRANAGRATYRFYALSNVGSLLAHDHVSGSFRVALTVARAGKPLVRVLRSVCGALRWMAAVGGQRQRFLTLRAG